MKIQRSQKKDILALATVYEAAFASNVFPDNMTEEEGDDNADLSPAISIQRDDLITLTIYENGIIAGGAILDCTGKGKNRLERFFISPEFQNRGLGFSAWKEIEREYSENRGWTLRTPTCLMNNIFFYVNKCGFHIVRVEDIGDDGIGMFVFEK